MISNNQLTGREICHTTRCNRLSSSLQFDSLHSEREINVVLYNATGVAGPVVSYSIAI